MNFYLNVFNKFNRNGYFGNLKNIYKTNNFHTTPYKNTPIALTNELHLLQYFLNYVLNRQRLAKTIYPSVSLSNIDVLPNVNLALCNIIKKNMVEYNLKDANIRISLINNITRNPEILNVFKEFNLMFSKDYNNINALINNDNNNTKKRRNPDFDDYEVKSSKRTKVLTKNSISDNFDETQNANEIDLMVKYPTNSSDPFNLLINIWKVNKISNPHIDHTYRAVRKSNFKRKFTPCNRRNTISCLVIYDEEIKRLEGTINNVARDILNLQQEYYVNQDLNISWQINDRIKELQLYENFFKNKYASICESRNEIFQLYVNRKKSPLNFNAEYIPRTELEIHSKAREMLYQYEEFYSQF